MKAQAYPWDVDFQKALVAHCLRVPSKGGNILKLVEPERFTTRSLRVLVATAQAYAADNHGTAPSFTELKQLVHRANYDGQLEDAHAERAKLTLSKLRKANGVDTSMIVKAVYEEARSAALGKALDKAIKLAGTGKVEEAWQLFEEHSVVGKELQQSGRTLLLPRDMKRVLEEARSVEKLKRQKSPCSQLDFYMRGGVGPGELAVILGCSGFGKSFWMSDTMVQALLAGDARVIYYTFEMSASDIIMRTTANLLDMRITEDLERGKISPLKAQKLVNQILKERDSQYIVHHAASRSMSVKDIRQHLKRLWIEYKFRPTFIIVDYADLVRSVSKRRHDQSMGTYIEQGDVYEDLINLADEYEVGMWTGCQATRDAMDERVLHQDHVAESFRKVHLAAWIVSICSQAEERAAHQVRLFLAKARFGESNVELGPFTTDLAKGRFIIHEKGSNASDDEEEFNEAA